MGKFWEWHKRVVADDRPILGFAEQTDDDGKKEGFVWFMGSYYYYNEKPKQKMNMPLMIRQLNAMKNMPHPWDRKKIGPRQELIDVNEE